MFSIRNLIRLSALTFGVVFFVFLQLFAHSGKKRYKDIHQLNEKYALYEICKNDIEGFSKKIFGRTYKYPCFRQDVRDALISRATTGKMGIEMLTGKVPDYLTEKTVTFFFYADIDLNLREPFDVWVNGHPLLTFNAQSDGSLKIISNPSNGNAVFILLRRDHNNDGIGAFRLTVPSMLIEKGKSAQIKIQGHKKGSNSWFMIFKVTDAVSNLKASVIEEVAFNIKQQADNIEIDAPSHFAGKGISVISDGVKSKKVHFEKNGNISSARIKAKTPQRDFKILYGEENLKISFPNGDRIMNKTEISGPFIIQLRSTFLQGWVCTVTKFYRPTFYNSFEHFFDRKYKDGLVALLNSSHQDIAWMNNPAQCIIDRDTMLITPILKDVLVRKDYGFDIEDGLMLREYLERHPDAKEKISDLLKKKWLSVGASYNCPYEDMYDAEDQVRQFYLGKRWVKKMFDGYDAKVYWNVDVPGKTLQLPQILKKAGVDYMVISRHGRGLFYWKSPDGSQILTYSPGHYGDDYIYLEKDMPEKIKYTGNQVVFWSQFYKSGKVRSPLLSDQDMLPAIDYSDFINTWNHFKSVKDENGKTKTVYFPEMDLMTVDEFMPLVQKYADNIDTIHGERPNVWVYIHGPGHHNALTASREGSKILPAAEKFLVIAFIIDPIKMPYPTEELDEAWQAKIYPDHGWGGHDGDITDNLFKQKLIMSRSKGTVMLKRAIAFIARRINTKTEKSVIPVIVFNSLSWERDDPVKVSVAFPRGEIQHLKVKTSNNETISSQLSDMSYYPDGSLKKANVHFLAKNIPSIGYKTYYLQNTVVTSDPKFSNKSVTKTENEYYTVSFDKGGIAQIYDKELDKNLLNTNSLMGGEVFTLQSFGTGAGEFGDIQQPTMENFDHVSKHEPIWEVIEQGDVFTKYRLRQEIKHATIEQEIILYSGIKQINFFVKLLNWSGQPYREFRTAFPLNMKHANIIHEVPFGTVKVGKDEIVTAGERYTPLCKDVHPRGIVDWIAASDNEIAVTISSSVAVADWVNPMNNNSYQPLLQHVLLASRRSCHSKGNNYFQAGNHDFHHILTSHKPNDHTGMRRAKQENEPLQIVLNPDRISKPKLPEEASFFGVDKDNVILTTIKKAEENDNIIVRAYDVNGISTNVKLTSFFPINSIKKTNIIEENPVPVSKIHLGKYAIETFEIETEYDR